MTTKSKTQMGIGAEASDEKQAATWICAIPLVSDANISMYV